MEVRRLYIGGIYPDITETDLKDRFSTFGTVDNVDIKVRKGSQDFPGKTFAHLDLKGEESSIHKCIKTFNGTKWKGSELKIQIAKENFLTRLQKERSCTGDNTAEATPSTTKPFNREVKGPPGTEVPGKQNWVVGKFGRALPVVNLKKDGKKFPQKIDPSKFVHGVKNLDNAKGKVVEDDTKVDPDKLTWQLDMNENEMTRKRKGEFKEWKSKTKQRKSDINLSTEDIIKKSKEKYGFTGRNSDGGDEEFEIVDPDKEVHVEPKSSTSTNVDLSRYRSDSDDDLDRGIPFTYSTNYLLDLITSKPKDMADTRGSEVGILSKKKSKKKQLNVGKGNVKKNQINMAIQDEMMNDDKDVESDNEVPITASKSKKSRNVNSCIFQADSDNDSDSDNSVDELEIKSPVMTRKSPVVTHKSPVIYPSIGTSNSEKQSSVGTKMSKFSTPNIPIKQTEIAKNTEEKMFPDDNLVNDNDDDFEVVATDKDGQTSTGASKSNKVDLSRFESDSDSDSDVDTGPPLTVFEANNRAINQDLSGTAVGASDQKNENKQMGNGNPKKSSTRLTGFKGTKMLQKDVPVMKIEVEPRDNDYVQSVNSQSYTYKESFNVSKTDMDRINKTVSESTVNEYSSGLNEVTSHGTFMGMIDSDHGSSFGEDMDQSEDEGGSNDISDHSIMAKMKHDRTYLKKSLLEYKFNPVNHKTSIESDSETNDIDKEDIKSANMKESDNDSSESEESDDEPSIDRTTTINKIDKNAAIQGNSAESGSSEPDSGESESEEEEESEQEESEVGESEKSESESVKGDKNKTTQSKTKPENPSRKVYKSDSSDSDSTSESEDDSEIPKPKLTTSGEAGCKDVQKTKSAVIDKLDLKKPLQGSYGGSITTNQDKELPIKHSIIVKTRNPEEDERQRSEAVRQKHEENVKQIIAVQNALANISKGSAVNKKIVFDDSSDDDDDGDDDDNEDEVCSNDDDDDDDDVSADDSDSDNEEKNKPEKKAILEKKATLDSSCSSDDSDSSDKQMAPSKGAMKEKFEEKKLSLFDESSSDDESGSDNEDGDDGDSDDENRFAIKPQFEGASGSKLLELQSTYGNDKRFQLDERFAESDSEEEIIQDTEDGSEEKQNALKILESVVGFKVTTDKKKEKPKSTFKDVTSLHYDPTREEHKQFELTKEEVSKKNLKSKHTAEDNRQLEEKTDSSVEKIQERFVEVSDSFKEAFTNKDQTAGNQPFSLLQAFGTAGPDEDNEIDSAETNNKDRLPLDKRFMDRNERDDIGDNGEEDTEVMVTDEHYNTDSGNARKIAATSKPRVFKERPSFFFKQDDERLQGGTRFFRTESLDVIREQWKKEKQDHIQRFKLKAKNFTRKMGKQPGKGEKTDIKTIGKRLQNVYGKGRFKSNRRM